MEQPIEYRFPYLFAWKNCFGLEFPPIDVFADRPLHEFWERGFRKRFDKIPKLSAEERKRLDEAGLTEGAERALIDLLRYRDVEIVKKRVLQREKKRLANAVIRANLDIMMKGQTQRQVLDKHIRQLLLKTGKGRKPISRSMKTAVRLCRDELKRAVKEVRNLYWVPSKRVKSYQWENAELLSRRISKEYPEYLKIFKEDELFRIFEKETPSTIALRLLKTRLKAFFPISLERLE